MNTDTKDAYSKKDLERFYGEHNKTTNRTDFERDRARIVHSSALRRLGAKTQVLEPESNDFVRTRLTHSLEVAQVGRQLGKRLGANPDLVDAACLAHDLGHPPFGHSGEKVLNDIAKEIGGFEGNAQTFRILTRLEPKIFNSKRSVGLNLTRASLDASIKYPWGNGFSKDGKFGYYNEDFEIYNWVRKTSKGENRRCIEAQIMDLADDISYSVHDIEDATIYNSLDITIVLDNNIKQNIIELSEGEDKNMLEQAYHNLLKDGFFDFKFTGTRKSYAELKKWTSSIIGRFFTAIETATRNSFGLGALRRYNANLIVPDITEAEISILKGIAWEYYLHPRVEVGSSDKRREIIESLVSLLMDNSPKPSVLLQTVFLDDWENAGTENERLRIAIDQVASLTDHTAKSTLNRLL